MSGDITAGGLSEENAITGSSVTGAVGGGYDNDEFSGTIEECSFDSRARIEIGRSNRTIPVVGISGYTTYRFRVTGVRTVEFDRR